MTRVFALLSWYDEAPDHLTRCVRSLEGFADVLVACDGAYATYPDARAQSPLEQSFALHDAVYESGMAYKITSGYSPWPSEVAKRAALFGLGRQAGATADDWFLIIDADMSLAMFTSEARDKLAATESDVAEVKWHDVMINEMPSSTMRFRSMFRALPGLTVERAHYLYTVPRTGPLSWPGNSDPESRDARRFLWHMPNGRLSDEPVLDLTGDVTLHHFNSRRDPERKARALEYYRDRDERCLESAGDWR